MRRSAALRAGVLVLAGGAAAFLLMKRGAKPFPSVTVAVYDDGAPQVGRTVVFHDAKGAVAFVTRTGRDGRASSRADALPAAVTVALGTSLKHLVTVHGVVAGEEIVIGEKEDEGDPGKIVATPVVALPGRFSGAATHAVTVGLGSIEARDLVQGVSVLERVVHDGRFAVLAEARTAKGEPLAYSFALGDVSLAGPLVLPPWSTDFRPLTIAIKNADARQALHEVAIVDGRNVRFDLGMRAERFLVPAPLAEKDALVEVDLVSGEGRYPDVDRCVVVRRARLGPSEIVFDAAKDFLPRVEAPKLDRGVVEASLSGDGDAADAAVAKLSWPATREHVWTLVAPPPAKGERVRIPIPELPPELADWRMPASEVRVGVALVESSEFANYGEVRKKGIDTAKETLDDDAEGAFRWCGTREIAF
jgi:hypothetical protein